MLFHYIVDMRLLIRQDLFDYKLIGYQPTLITVLTAKLQTLHILLELLH